MTDALHRALLAEQYSHPTRQWHPSVDDLIAAAERNDLLDDDTTEGRQTA